MRIHFSLSSPDLFANKPRIVVENTKRQFDIITPLSLFQANNNSFSTKYVYN